MASGISLKRKKKDLLKAMNRLSVLGYDYDFRVEHEYGDVIGTCILDRSAADVALRRMGCEILEFHAHAVVSFMLHTR